LKDKIKIALAQFESKIGDVEQNIDKFIRSVEYASKNGADIICFPELFATGYNLNILKRDIEELSQRYYDRLVKVIQETAIKNSIYIIAPIGIPKEEKLYNGAIFVDSNGKVIGEYNKTHSFYLEKAFFNEGEEFKVFNTELGRIGILICYDIGFPEAARSLCLKGADIIFVPSAWRIQDENSWLLNIPSRALENQLFTVGINRYGIEGDLHLFGGSMVCNPYGDVVCKMPNDIDSIEVFEIDYNEIKDARSEIGYLNDRKPNIYGICCQPQKMEG